ncbi:putative C6 transcription factor [Aspergillus thermomutatus]|uniref:Transcription factor domain-containing protein n=1 Tax=Aspergillus thermomutatus TaxID=41047 RepID=A0A397G5V1_ASPTH|nr:uncharacterized protein CDV56_101449 [Aspergillus thermomutatus]RHZ43500.1 hypothetical protein CDV56_101449 [Aspergillus thermomutatus]
MTFGRPAAIPNSYVKLELPSDYKLTDELPISNSQVDALGLAFFNSTITLYKQMWNTMELLYGQNLGCDSSLSVSQTIAHTFSIEQSVFSWERSLPDTLRLTSCESLRNDRSESATNLQSVTWKLRVILTLRYLNLRVLLHRPVLVKFLDSCSGLQTDAQELKLLQQMGLNSLQICADSAIEIIDLVHHVVSSTGWKQELLGAWWFSLYYTFNAALVIFGTIRVCRDESRTGASMPILVDRAKSYPSRATAALLKLDTGNRMVDRCRLFLERFNSSLSTPEQNPLSSDSTTHFNLSGSGPMAFGGEMDYSPLGMEFGEFMMDGDLLSLMSRPDIPPQADLQ